MAAGAVGNKPFHEVEGAWQPAELQTSRGDGVLGQKGV